MILRFDTHDAAAIFAGRKRADGYYAGILDEGTGFLWGPMAVGGFRVVITDNPVDEEMIDEEKEDEQKKYAEASGVGSEFRLLMRLLIVAWAFSGLFAAVVIFLRGLDDPRQAIGPFLVYVLSVPVIGLLLVPLLVGMTRALRNANSAVGGFLKALVCLWVIAQLLGMLVVIVLAIFGKF